MTKKHLGNTKRSPEPGYDSKAFRDASARLLSHTMKVVSGPLKQKPARMSPAPKHKQ